jgi:hypothetical protein
MWWYRISASPASGGLDRAPGQDRRGTASIPIADQVNPRILLLRLAHRSDRRKESTSPGQLVLLSQRQVMSTLDEITQEKQRVSEALARIDAQRQKLAGQLGELEATERVLARYSTGTKRTVSAKSPPSPTKAVAPAQRQRGRRPATTAKPGDGRRTSATLSDQVLALATGRTQHEIASACKGARPNHVGAAISRHKRAGRIEERDGKLYASQATEAAQHAAVQ